jgi:hypothetical protein
MLIDYIHRPVCSIYHDVGCSGVKPIQLGPVERADLDHHRNVVIYRKNRTMGIFHKHSSLGHRVPSSESFQAYL